MSQQSTDTSEIGVYRRMYDDRFREIDELLADLPSEALLWKPFETSAWKGASGQLGWLIAHALSSTVYLLKRAEFIMGRTDWSAVEGDEGADEFGPANHDPEYLRARAAHAQAFVHQFLDSLSQTDLETSRPHPRRTHWMLVARFDIQHAFEHMSQHIGHAQLTRQLWALQQK